MRNTKTCKLYPLGNNKNKCRLGYFLEEEAEPLLMTDEDP